MADDNKPKDSVGELAEMVMYRVKGMTTFLEQRINSALAEARKFSEEWNGNIGEIINKSHTQIEFGPKTLALLERIAVALETSAKKSNYPTPIAC